MFRFIIICLVLFYVFYDQYYDKIVEFMGANSGSIYKWSIIGVLIIICLIPNLDQKIFGSINYIRKMPAKNKSEYKYNNTNPVYYE